MAQAWQEIAPKSVLFVSPHPDDICIGMGGLAAFLAERAESSTMLLVTDGSEGRMAKQTLVRHEWTEAWTAPQSARLRGEIRVAEARREAEALGIDRVETLTQQTWHTEAATPAEAMDAHGGLIDVAGFRPGAVTDAARAAVAAQIEELPAAAVVCLPAPNDRQAIHRITTWMVLDALAGSNKPLTLAFYEPLSSLGWETLPAGLARADFAFGADLADRKATAIAAHRSQLERRAAFGSYTSADNRDYRQIARDRDQAYAKRAGVSAPFTEPCVMAPASSAVSALLPVAAPAC
ncbi:MAG: PIG-L family deacetylase [Rhodobacter sp.]|nr:PIG-L family deacetylase [Rhodobacter sp.]